MCKYCKPFEEREPDVDDFNSPTTTNLPAEFYAALDRGEKIRAIKIFRKRNGVSLKLAKDFVDLADTEREANKAAAAAAADVLAEVTEEVANTKALSAARSIRLPDSLTPTPRNRLEEYLRKRFDVPSESVTWRSINDLLNELASSQFKAGQDAVRTDLGQLHARMVDNVVKLLDDQHLEFKEKLR